MDIYSEEKRSLIMRSIRPQGNASTELRLIQLMRAAKISGWRRKEKLLGKPDFVFRRHRIAVFVDGDFWHGNPKTFVAPKTRTEFWITKIVGNRQRDKRNTLALRKMGWTVLRIWESDLKKRPNYCAARIHRIIKLANHKMFSKTKTDLPLFKSSQFPLTTIAR